MRRKNWKGKVLVAVLSAAMVMQPFSAVQAAELGFSDGAAAVTESEENTFADSADGVDAGAVAEASETPFSNSAVGVDAEAVAGDSETDVQLTYIKSSWTSHTSAEITFVSNKAGGCYMAWAEEGTVAPTISSMQRCFSVEANQESTVNYTNIGSEKNIVIYVAVRDYNGNTSDVIAASLDSASRPKPEPVTIQIGDNVYARIDGDTMTVSGSGNTYDDNWYIFDLDYIYRNRLKNVKKVTFDGTYTELWNNFFNTDFYTSLEEVVLPEGMTSIGENAFLNVSTLKNITFPSTLKTIGSDAFGGCTALKEISLPENLTTIGDGAFYGCEALEEIKLPESLTTIGGSAFYNCKNLTNIDLPDGIISIGSSAFSRTGLISVNWPKALTEIPVEVFAGCTSLETIAIPETVTRIDTMAFENCTSLKEITIPESVTQIDSAAFFGCTSLEEISIPESVTEIANNAFSSCTGLTKASIPKTVTYFGNDVFYNCRNLTIYGYKDSLAEKYADNNYIKFVSADYRVAFKNEGRTVSTQYVLKGENATAPTLTEKAGYTLSWDGDYTNIQEDMTINAVWTKKDSGSSSGGNSGGTTIIITNPTVTPTPSVETYTVTFQDRGKIVKTEKVESGKAAEYPLIQRDGYRLTWDQDFSEITGDVTVNAVWTVITPAKVGGLEIEVQKTALLLSWDETEYSSYYLVYRKAASEKEFTQVAKTANTLWKDKNAATGVDYQYQIVAVRSVDKQKYQSEASEIATAQISMPKVGNIYTVGYLKYLVKNAKEVSVAGFSKTVENVVIPLNTEIAGISYKVTSIEAKAFYKNENIASVKIGNNITTIGKYAFAYCPNLETVKFGKNVQTIGAAAFRQCTSLTGITLPAKVSKIGKKAFYHCKDIQTLVIKSTCLTSLGQQALAASSKTVIKVPKTQYKTYQKLIKKSGVYKNTQIKKL